jgi:hypothetical protein
MTVHWIEDHGPRPFVRLGADLGSLDGEHTASRLSGRACLGDCRNCPARLGQMATIHGADRFELPAARAAREA